MLKNYGSAVVLAACLGLATPGWAQTNPSADDLIKSLQPTAQTLQSSGTRGLHRLAPESATAPPAPAAQEPVGAKPMPHTAAVGRVASKPASASIYVQFATGSAELTPAAMAAVDELGKALSSSALSTYHFRIEGHTDTVGSKTLNRTLSERRAGAVVAYIEQKFNIDASRLVAVGLGSDHLLVQTPDQTPEARNRRVEIVNVGT